MDDRGSNYIIISYGSTGAIMRRMVSKISSDIFVRLVRMINHCCALAKAMVRKTKNCHWSLGHLSITRANELCCLASCLLPVLYVE